MSVKLMKALWKSDLPATHRYVGLAFADYANDNGVCWPSIGSITRMTGLGTRTVRGSISYLKKAGVLSSKTSIKNGTIYTFNLAQLDPSCLCNICTKENAIFAQSDGSSLCKICHEDMQILQRENADVAKDTYIENHHKETPIEPPSKKRVVSEWEKSQYGFDSFWAAYPRKDDKKKALDKWLKLKPSEQLVSEIISHIENRIASGMWNPVTGKKYIMQPTRFINGANWNDEIISCDSRSTCPTDREGFQRYDESKVVPLSDSDLLDLEEVPF